jgi:hypothetical protein
MIISRTQKSNKIKYNEDPLFKLQAINNSKSYYKEHKADILRRNKEQYIPKKEIKDMQKKIEELEGK